ncbi:unnamed protein product [Staurois parvus]|uniref:Uncharacterized protein n=1 Tax=Staurois parvus TaxID=386267 RepID=A0ABN9HKW5_9NEOB|nr:unnamed protein product [Staurois parvus]
MLCGDFAMLCGDFAMLCGDYTMLCGDFAMLCGDLRCSAVTLRLGCRRFGALSLTVLPLPLCHFKSRLQSY